MYTLLLVVLLLALLFDTVAATSPAMDPNLTVSIETFSSHPDLDGILDTLCQFCNYPLEICNCLVAHQPVLPQPLPNLHAENLLGPPVWPQEAGYDELPAEPQPALPSPPFFVPIDSPPLAGAIVRSLDDNGTTIQPSTIQVFVEGIYNPGDRLQAPLLSSPPKPHKRQAPKRGGFPCLVEGCGSKPFNRSCDLNRHRRTAHLSRSERPHKCPVCNRGFLYPKDLNRHQTTHDQSLSASATLYCEVPGCANVDGFSRRDNLLRHHRTQHSTLVSA